MRVKFWGTRGSLPQALNHNDMLAVIDDLVTVAKDQGIKTLRTFQLAAQKGDLRMPISYGGNTSCTEVLHKDQSFFVDMGSGLREAGSYYMAKGQKEFHIFLTHMHWDHIMGLPFFVPVHAPGCVTRIYYVHRTTPEYVKINFNGVNFPLTWDQLGGKIEFEQMTLYQPKKIGDMSITAFALDHPGGSFGFRFDAGGKAAAVGVDGEYKRTSPKDLGKDLACYQNLDLLVFDAQYELAELASRFDWGHCSPNIGVDLALREGIRNLAFTHHDPWSTPVKIRRMYDAAEKHLKMHLPAFKEVWSKKNQPEGPKLLSAYDGLLIDLDNA